MIHQWSSHWPFPDTSSTRGPSFFASVRVQITCSLPDQGQRWVSHSCASFGMRFKGTTRFNGHRSAPRSSGTFSATSKCRRLQRQLQTWAQVQQLCRARPLPWGTQYVSWQVTMQHSPQLRWCRQQWPKLPPGENLLSQAYVCRWRQT